MTHVLVTGAQGFIGQVLVRQLLQAGLGGRPVARLSLLDLQFDAPHADPRVRQCPGSVADACVRASALDEPLDVVFHLASVPGGAAERDHALGRRVNLDATVGLLEELAAQAAPPRFVYASSVAVYGDALGAVVDDHSAPAPALSYGAHKLACEVLVADASRRRWVDGISLRLPGVVPRPGSGAGLMSAFMSQIFWRLAAGEPLTLPVSPDGTAWWLSAAACADNLRLAATLDLRLLDARRCCQMPALWLRVDAVVAAVAGRYGHDPAALVRHAPAEAVQRLFARYPPLATPMADALGLRHDGDVAGLVARAFEAHAGSRDQLISSSTG